MGSMDWAMAAGVQPPRTEGHRPLYEDFRGENPDDSHLENKSEESKEGEAQESQEDQGGQSLDHDLPYPPVVRSFPEQKVMKTVTRRKKGYWSWLVVFLAGLLAGTGFINIAAFGENGLGGEWMAELSIKIQELTPDVGYFLYILAKRGLFFYFSCGNDFTLPEKFDIISIYGIFWVLSGSDRFMGDSGLRGQGPLAAPGVFPSPFSFVYSIVSYDDPMESGSISCSLFKRPGKPAVFRFPDTGCGMRPGMLRQSGVGTFFCDYSAMGLRKKKRSK